MPLMTSSPSPERARGAEPVNGRDRATPRPDATADVEGRALAAHIARARDIENYAGRRAARHAAVASRNRRIRYCVGVPAAVLAFIAGSAAVADWSQIVTAISAFVASALSTTLGFIKPEEGRVRHSQLRAEWLLLQWTAGAVCADAGEAGLESTRSAVRRLREQMHDLDRTDV